MLIVIDDVLEAEILAIKGESDNHYPYVVYKRTVLELTEKQKDALYLKVRGDRAQISAELVYSLQTTHWL